MAQEVDTRDNPGWPVKSSDVVVALEMSSGIYADSCDSGTWLIWRCIAAETKT